MAKERIPLTDAVEGDRRGALIAIRDYIAVQLEGHLCSTCLNSRLRTGDQAALILRLSKVMEEIDVMTDPDEEVSDLDELRLRVLGERDDEESPLSGPNARHRTEEIQRRNEVRERDTDDDDDSPLTGKSAQRRTGTRRPGAGRKPKSEG
jgi:hypothetical protein